MSILNFRVIKNSLFILILLMIAGLSWLASQSISGGLGKIHLTDGSIVSGEIVSYIDGIYTIKSKTLGTLRISSNSVDFIAFNDQGLSGQKTASPSTTTIESSVNSIRTAMMGNQQVWAKIINLQNDPQFQKIINDPDIIKAVNAGDFSSLLSNPKFIKLLDHPAVRDIEKQLKKE